MSVLSRTLLFVVVVHGFFLAALPWALLASGLRFFAFPSIPLWAAVPPAAAGLWLYAVTVRDFVSVGKGTPAAWDPPARFVRSNGYRWTRNPMYVGMFLTLSAEALFFRSSALVVYLAVLWFTFHLFVIGHEEPSLRKKFGADYENYLNEVPRWFGRPGRK